MKFLRARIRVPSVWLSGIAICLLLHSGLLLQSQETPRRIQLGVIPGGLRYDIQSFQVQSGEAVELVFHNNGLMPHNWLLVEKGKLEAVIADAVALGVNGLTKDYIPSSPHLLEQIPLVQPGKSHPLTFKAPTENGEYPYVCTFPGHSNLMRGVMTVVDKTSEVTTPAKVFRESNMVPDALVRSIVDPFPKGSVTHPYVIRTFMPDPGLDPGIFQNHQRGFAAANYDPGKGTDVPGIAPTDQGLPAAIGVNFGKALSYCWDTVECRLMYAWTGDFLDMGNYWGKGTGGRRQSFNYLPRMIGKVRFKTQGPHPMYANFKTSARQPKPQYRGYQLVDGAPEFYYSMQGYSVRERIRPKNDQSLRIDYSIQASGHQNPIYLQFDQAIRPSLEISHGRWNGNEWVLSTEEALQFNLTLRF